MSADNMIKGYCRTNLDGYDCEAWPTYFGALPRVGDRVKACSGTTLKVVSVTFGQCKPVRLGPSSHTVPDPYIEVELNK